MKDCIVVTGGRADEETLKSVLRRHLNDRMIIAADKGLAAVNKAGIVPDLIIGDFDSADADIVGAYRKLAEKNQDIQFVDLDVHKDMSDTQAAVLYAMQLGAESIYMVGATGTRLDHTLANIGLLKLCAERDIPAFIEDDHNIITMLISGCDVHRIEGYDNISFLPYGGDVSDVTLTGFEYLTHKKEFLCATASLGVSNRIVSDTARIDFSSGCMLMIYSRD